MNSSDRSFEDLLADPHEQFDPGRELLERLLLVGVERDGRVEEFGAGDAGAGVAREEIANHGGRLVRKVQRTYVDGSMWIGPWTPAEEIEGGE